MRSRSALLAAVLFVLVAQAPGAQAQEASLEAGRKAYENSEYVTAIEILKAAAAKEPDNGEVQLLLAKAYLGADQFDAAVTSGERAVAINPKNSE